MSKSKVNISLWFVTLSVSTDDNTVFSLLFSLTLQIHSTLRIHPGSKYFSPQPQLLLWSPSHHQFLLEWSQYCPNWPPCSFLRQVSVRSQHSNNNPLKIWIKSSYFSPQISAKVTYFPQFKKSLQCLGKPYITVTPSSFLPLWLLLLLPRPQPAVPQTLDSLWLFGRTKHFTLGSLCWSSQFPDTFLFQVSIWQTPLTNLNLYSMVHTLTTLLKNAECSLSSNNLCYSTTLYTTKHILYILLIIFIVHCLILLECKLYKEAIPVCLVAWGISNTYNRFWHIVSV